MSFSTYTVVTAADAAKGTGMSVALQKLGKFQTSAKLVVTLRPAIAKSLGWANEDRIEVQLGEDEHHGLIRLRKSADGSAILKHTEAARGTFFILRLGHIPLYVDRTEARKWVSFDQVEDGWVEVVLPTWADETGPKAQAERARRSAGIAPAFVPPAPTKRLTSQLMGDPDPARSALAQRGRRELEMTRGEAQRLAERREAESYARAEAADHGRQAIELDRLADIVRVFGLTKNEAMVVAGLLDGRAKSREALHDIVYTAEPGERPDIKIIDVWMSKARRKLQTRLVEIETVRGVGFRISADGIARIRSLLDTAAEPSREDDEAELARLAEAEAGQQ